MNYNIYEQERKVKSSKGKRPEIRETDDALEKKCTKCDEFKTLDNFYNDARGFLNKKSYCKQCDKRGKGIRVKKADHKIINGITLKKCTKCNNYRELKEFNKDKKGFLGLKSDCKKCLGKRRTSLDYRNKRRESFTDGYDKKYYKSYYQKHKDEYKERAHKRYSKQKELIATLTSQEWEENLKGFHHKCSYCGKQEEKMHQEHIIPVTKDGGYTKQNIIPACQSCNYSKGNKDMETWYREQPFFNIKQLRKIQNHMGIKNNKQQLALF